MFYIKEFVRRIIVMLVMIVLVVLAIIEVTVDLVVLFVVFIFIGKVFDFFALSLFLNGKIEKISYLSLECRNKK